MGKPTLTPTRPSVRLIHVEDLFGYLTYTLGDTGQTSSDAERLMILYGDNGSGKTTLLNLLYHSLSTETRAGHKTKIAKIPFRSFRVEFAGGEVLEVVREGTAITGTFTQSFQRSPEDRISHKYVIDQDGDVPWVDGEPDRALRLRIEQLGLSIHFLDDSRKIVGTGLEDQNDESGAALARKIGEGHLAANLNLGRIIFSGPRSEVSPLQAAIQRLVSSLQRRALTASNKGELDVNKIYKGIVSAISDESYRASAIEISQIIQRLEDISNKNDSFSRYGLIPNIDAEGLSQFLSGAPKRSWKLIGSVLTPYIDSLGARLEAYEELRDTIDSFVDTMRSFYRDKEIVFSLQDGVRIIGAQGNELSPDVLSSGEKQLLLLFCNILASTGGARLFLIDEPEISLNVKWQRKVVDSMLRCTRNAAVQFIMATHSIEILAKHRQAVRKLTNEK